MSNDTTFVSSIYPVTISIDPAIEGRNRLTTGFRIILNIPHAILVQGSHFGVNGVLGAVAAVCAVISWFAIVFTGSEPRGRWDLRAFYLRWRLNAQAYVFLLRDEYPPFGEGEYPAKLTLDWPETARNRASVGLRIFYVIPHVIVLLFLVVAALVCTIINWFAIVFTGRLTQGLGEFVRNVLRWSMRVEAYALLMRDEYPPFSLSE